MELKTIQLQVVEEVELTLNSFCSALILWTEGVLYSAYNKPLVSVRFPDPEGP